MAAPAISIAPLLGNAAHQITGSAGMARPEAPPGARAVGRMPLLPALSAPATDRTPQLHSSLHPGAAKEQRQCDQGPGPQCAAAAPCAVYRMAAPPLGLREVLNVSATGRPCRCDAVVDCCNAIAAACGCAGPWGLASPPGEPAEPV